MTIAGTPYTIEIPISDPAGVLITGLSTGSIVATIRDATPGATHEGWFLDFSDNTFKSTGWTTKTVGLAERATAPGMYYRAGGFVTTGLAGTFVISYGMTIAIDTTSVPATDTVFIEAAGGGAATSTDVNDARDVITAQLTGLEGAGFGTSTDSLHQLAGFVSALDDKISNTQVALGVLNSFTTQVGTTSTAIHTNCAYATGTWNDQELLSFDPTDASRTVSRRIISQVLGVFTVEALPWTPDSGDSVLIMARVAPAKTTELSTAQSAITTAVSGSTTDVNAHTDTVAAALPGTVNTALGSAHGTGSWASATGFATPTNVTDAVTAIEAYGQLHWTTAIVAGLSTLTAAESASAIWDALTSAHATGGSFAALFKANLDAAMTTRMATFSYTSPPTAAAISTVVNSDLTTAHGTGPYTATDISTLAKSTEISDVLAAIAGISSLTAQQVADAVWNALTSAHSTGSSFAALVKANLDAAITSRASTTTVTSARDHIEAYGQTNWTTASTSAITSSLNTLADSVSAIPTTAAPTASAVATAVLAAPEGGAALSIGWAIQLIRKWTTWTSTTQNKKSIASDGLHLVVTDDNGSTTLATVPLAALGAAAVVPETTEAVSLG